MFRASYKIATVFGIPIKLHISVILLLLVYGRNFLFPSNLLIGLGILLSIALHELGHSLVAISKKCRVREITLWFMGGVAQMESIPRKPLDESLMAIAGPMVSLVLGGAFLLAGKLLPMPDLLPTIEMNIFEFLGWANLMLACFNLVPAFPMDGGRVLRAILTPFLGRLRATKIASNIGKLVAIGFVVLAFYAKEPVFFFLGIFLYFIAGREYRMVEIQEHGRRFSFWDWVRTASGNPPPPQDAGDEDQVIISPPPYKRGPASRSRISEDTKGPFDSV